MLDLQWGSEPAEREQWEADWGKTIDQLNWEIAQLHTQVVKRKYRGVAGHCVYCGDNCAAYYFPNYYGGTADPYLTPTAPERYPVSVPGGYYEPQFAGDGKAMICPYHAAVVRRWQYLETVRTNRRRGAQQPDFSLHFSKLAYFEPYAARKVGELDPMMLSIQMEPHIRRMIQNEMANGLSPLARCSHHDNSKCLDDKFIVTPEAACRNRACPFHKEFGKYLADQKKAARANQVARNEQNHEEA